MGQIIENPIVSLQANIGAPLLYYLADGAAVFGCIGNPDGVIVANKRSLALSDNGNVYFKTTDGVSSGWNALGGGGSGTVTSIGLTGNSVLDFSGSSANPITSAGIFNINFVPQSVNKVFASPSSGAPAIPTFRALLNSDLSLAAFPINGGIHYNDGTNGLIASAGFKFDAASTTVQIGEATVAKGTVQLFSNLGLGTIKHTVNNPGGNFVFIWPDTLPVNNDLARFSVSGSNVTIGSVAASALGFPTINPTDNFLPYRSSATAFSDSPLRRLSSSMLGFGTTSNDVGIGQNTSGVLGIGRGDSVVTSMPLECSAVYLNQFNNQTASVTVSAERALGIAIANNLVIGWNANATFNPAPTLDTSFARLAANVVRIANGGTGAGQLAIGTSTASTANQFLVDSQSTSRIAGFFSMPNGSSVPTIQGVTNGIQSFAFNPSGKLQGGCNIPTSNQQFSAKGNLKSDVSELGNSGVSNTNLLSFTVPANSIANNGDTVEFTTTVVYAANANNKQVECLFGGVSVFLISDAYSGSQGQVTVRIKRTTSTAAKVIATYVASDTLLVADCQYNEIAVTWSNSNTFQVKGQATSNNDIINKELESNVIIAQTS